jgi:hypothetical protein
VADQLTVYAMYAMKKWRTSLESIRAMPIYLDIDDPKADLNELAVRHRITKPMIDIQVGVIKREFSLLQEADAQKADRTAFQTTENTAACRDCPFKEMCPGANQRIVAKP